ncbi:hypothetical protein, partial [Streptomyces palmae]
MSNAAEQETARGRAASHVPPGVPGPREAAPGPVAGPPAPPGDWHRLGAWAGTGPDGAPGTGFA